MSDDLPAVRISDDDRDRAVEFLRHHCGAGRLTLDEFSDRAGLVFAATNAHELEAITKDLPAVRLPPPVAAPPTAGRARRAVRWTASMIVSSKVRGRWRLDKSITAVSVLGHCEIDLRRAEITSNESTIDAFAFMGGVDIVVPDGVNVVLHGLALMGLKESTLARKPLIPGAPTIHVKAFAFMGGVTVRKGSGGKPRKRGRDRDPERARDFQRIDMRIERAQQRAQRHHDRMAHRHERMRGMPPAPPAPPAAAALPAIVRGIDAVAGAVRSDWPAMRARVAPEGTVTILFSDIEGFTSVTERLGDYAANALLQEHYRLVREQLAEHGGFEVKVYGDGFMVAFSSASRALRCAKAIQQAQRAWNQQHPDEPMRIRMGLHTGEAIRDADDFLGTTVNLASRIASAARGDEILVSSLLRELCISTGEFEFDDGTVVELRGLSQPHKVFAARW